MNVIRRIVVGLAGVVVVALVMELAAPKAVHALVSTLVTVANTSANPVPISGNVTAAVSSLPAVQVNGGTLNATINGTVPVTGTVAVSSLPAVALGGGSVNATVTNPAGTNGPVPLVITDGNNPAYQPASIILSTSGIDGGGTVPSTLPSGLPYRELVINWVSGLCYSSTTNPLSAVALGTDGSQYSFFAPISSPTQPTGPISGVQTFGSRTHLYASPGSHIDLFALNNNGTIKSSFTASAETVTGGNLSSCLISADGYYVTQ